jgi:hypothetical protein
MIEALAAVPSGGCFGFHDMAGSVLSGNSDNELGVPDE